MVTQKHEMDIDPIVCLHFLQHLITRTGCGSHAYTDQPHETPLFFHLMKIAVYVKIVIRLNDE